MISTLGKRVKLLKELMKCLVNDIELGIHPFEAGWIEIDSPEIKGLLNLELVEKGDRGIRLNFTKDLRIELGDIKEKDTLELLYICLDIAKAVNIEKLIINIISDKQKFPHIQPSLFIIGLSRMFGTSDFPVFVDEILSEGLSFDDWYFEAPKASWDFSIEIAKKWWKIDKENIFKMIKEFSLKIPDISEPKNIDKIRKILSWEEALKIFAEEECKALAFLWFVDYLSLSEGIRYPEVMTFIQARTWEFLEIDLGKKKFEIIDQIEEMVNRLRALTRSPFSQEELVSWSEIIRYPW